MFSNKSSEIKHLLKFKLNMDDVCHQENLLSQRRITMQEKYIKRIYEKDIKQLFFLLCTGGNFSCKRENVVSIGMFDENIFMYYEEADLSRRLRGMKGEHHIKFIGDLHLIHLENGSTPNSLVAIKTEIASCKYFSKKYGLSARKKLVADYRYMKFKNCIYKRLKKIEPYKEQLNIYREELLKIQ